jgi:sugar (pentulose or hexulose) kinase
MLLGLDLGTTNVKALITDLAGRPLGEGSCPVRLYHVADAGVEQDIEEIWQAVVSAIRGATRSVAPSGIKAVGVSSQGGAMQMLDDRGRPLSRVISWLDPRGRPFDEALNAELGHDWFAKRIGHKGSGLAIGQLLRLRAEQAGLLAEAHCVGFVGDIVVSRLCGRAGHDGTSCGLTLLYNPALHDYDPDVLRRLEMTAGQLPALLSPRQTAGQLLPAVAHQTGLPQGIPVSTAIHDQYAAALATRAVSAGTVMVGTGTAWVLLAVGPRLLPPVTNRAFACHHVVDGLWGQILSLGNGGSALTGALELTDGDDKSPQEIDRLLESTSPGRDGLLCWPVLASDAGLALDTRGQLSKLGWSHQPGRLLRAVLEGLAFELRRQVGFLHQAGLPAERLVLGGAAAASLITPQILAAVTGLPVVCAGPYGASPLGAAILARGLLEPTASLADLAKEMAPELRRIEVGPAAPMYDEQFTHYLRSQPSLQPQST